MMIQSRGAPLISSLIRAVPIEWTVEHRDLWLKAFVSSLDLLVPIIKAVKDDIEIMWGSQIPTES